MEYLGLLHAASILSEKNKCGLEKFEPSYPFILIEGYKANERAFATAESEHLAKIGKEDKDDDSMSLDKGGDSDAFANIEKQFGLESSSIREKR